MKKHVFENVNWPTLAMTIITVIILAIIMIYAGVKIYGY